MTFLLFILLLTQPTPRSTTQTCLNYEPDVITVTGTLQQQTFAGPPNYESVGKGDAAEKVLILRADNAICVNANTDNQQEKDVSDLQLVVAGQKQYRKYKSLVGRKVTVTGTLFQAHTGHHHTRVLLTVQALQQAKL